MWTTCNNITAHQLWVEAAWRVSAGEVSLANIVNMSCATKNIVLIGDQMQLSQPFKGTHPEGSGKSALDYYLEDQATIPADMGIFLP